jgi:hypothetical protein
VWQWLGVARLHHAHAQSEIYKKGQTTFSWKKAKIPKKKQMQISTNTAVAQMIDSRLVMTVYRL